VTTKHTVVVGGGVAGLCTAFYLRRLGHDVTLVEGSAVGAPVASSYGNGGWICPAQAGPLPAPGLASHGFRALLNRDSSLYFNPQYLPRLVPWLLRFWTYCNPRDHRAGTAALALLGRDVFELVDDMVASGMEFELHKKGMIVVASEERVARAALEKLEPMRSYGYGIPDSFMDADELHELEPVLSTKAKVGFLIEEQWHVRADSFVASLAGAVAEMGVSVRENTPVTGFKTRDGRVLAATTP
jgi:D-amino-acid dehydrogenase